ncbi:MAG: family 43 glycosylhydrolase [Hominilimicola sp.]
MNKKLFSVLLAAMICFTANICTAANQTNLIKNGSFEEEIGGTENWKFRNTNNWSVETSEAAECSDTEASDGKKSLTFTAAAIGQRVRLERNTSYILSVSLKAAEDSEVTIGIYDGTKDWPVSNPVTEKIAHVGTEWHEETLELECENTQEYVIAVTYWGGNKIYVDDVSLTEEQLYISKLTVGVDGDGVISYKADYTANEKAVFGAALYDGDNRLTDFKTSGKGSFERCDKYGKYKVKTYLWNDNKIVSRTEEIMYDENSAHTNQLIGAAKELTLSKHTLLLIEGGKDSVLDACITPEYAYNKEVMWSSSDENVALVSENGIVTPVGTGKAVITASGVNSALSDCCEVEVTAKTDVNCIKLDKNSVTLPEKDAVCVLNATGAEDIVWLTDNSGVAEVTDGVVTGCGKGTATITAKSADGEYSANCVVTVNESPNTITNDTFYKDTDGNPIYSQGGGIFQFNDKYYWYGVKYNGAVEYLENPSNGKNGNSSFAAFTCYSSDDLVNWRFEGYPMTNKTKDMENSAWVGRMGVAYNKNTKKYVLISQASPGVVFAYADKPEGPYTVDHFCDSIPCIENNMTGDQTVFQDDDGRAYLICSSASGRAYLYVVPLRESDFLDFDYDNAKMIFHDEDGRYIDEDGSVKNKDKLGIEGNCMFKYNGNYYFTGSDLYGWNSSRVYVMQSEDILGEYNEDTGLPYIMNGVKNNFAHNSQAGFYVTVHGSEKDLVLYCGDRWSDFAGNGIGYNQWIPVTMGDDNRPYFNDLHQWRLNMQKGTWEIGEGNNYIQNPAFEADRVSVTEPTGWSVYDTVGGYANSNVSGKIDSGNYVWQQSAEEDYTARLSQSVENLPDGEYVLKAWVKSSGGQNICNLYARSNGVEYNAPLKTEINGWTQVIIKNIAVKDGKCEIGLYSDSEGGNWAQIDNIELVKAIN